MHLPLTIQLYDTLQIATHTAFSVLMAWSMFSCSGVMVGVGSVIMTQLALKTTIVTSLQTIFKCQLRTWMDPELADIYWQPNLVATITSIEESIFSLVVMATVHRSDPLWKRHCLIP